MSQIPNMLESTIQKIREMVDVNSVIGEPISTPDGVTIIPVSKVSGGFGGGGSDFTKKTAAGDNPFGGGVGGGVKVTPICFLIVKDGNVRMMPVAEPASSTADRIVEMVPDTLDLTSSSSAFSRSFATSSCLRSMAFLDASMSMEDESPRFCLNTRSSSACLVDFTVSAALDALESLSTAACWSVICALREEIC